MAYIGNTPAESFASFEKQVFTIVNSQTAYTLNHAVTNENEIRLVVNNVVQEPGSGKAFTASGTTLTLSAALVNGTDEMYCVFLGRALQTVNPPNASVGSDQTAPTIITGQTAETSIATDDTILIHDTSASALRKMTRANFVSGIGGANTPAFEAILSSATTISHNTATKVQCNTEIFDTAGAYDNSTNFRFTPQVAGKYFVYAKVRIDSSPGNCEMSLSYLYKNGSSYTFSLIDFDNNDGEGGTTNQASVIDFNGSSDYVELYALGKNASGSGTLNLEGASSGYPTVFGAYKIIE